MPPLAALSLGHAACRHSSPPPPPGLFGLAQVFWVKGPTLAAWPRTIASIERGEHRLKETMNLEAALATKVPPS